MSREARNAARADLERLARRLQAALEFSESDLEDWSKSLVSLVDQASRGIWTSEARMLYERAASDPGYIGTPVIQGAPILCAYGDFFRLGHPLQKQNQ
jgi:hypothetical protein